MIMPRKARRLGGIEYVKKRGQVPKKSRSRVQIIEGLTGFNSCSMKEVERLLAHWKIHSVVEDDSQEHHFGAQHPHLTI